MMIVIINTPVMKIHLFFLTVEIKPLRNDEKSNRIEIHTHLIINYVI